MLAVVGAWQRHGGEGWAEGNLVGFDCAHVLASMGERVHDSLSRGCVFVYLKSVP